MKGKDERYPDYPLFKGLQRPLEFMGIQGRYIYWAAFSARPAAVRRRAELQRHPPVVIRIRRRADALAYFT